MIRSFAKLIGLLTGPSVLLTLSLPISCGLVGGIVNGRHDLGHNINITDKARQNLGMIIHAFENSTKRVTDNATRNLIALAYSLAGLYAIASNTISDENDPERYTKGSFACQLALGLGLAGFGYRVLHSGA